MCRPVWLSSKIWIRYMPRFGTPVSGWRVRTNGRVTKGPPSRAQVRSAGKRSMRGGSCTFSSTAPRLRVRSPMRSGSRARSRWRMRRPSVGGINSSGSFAARATSSPGREPKAWSTLERVPKRLVTTGKSRSRTRLNKSAGPARRDHPSVDLRQLEVRAHLGLDFHQLPGPPQALYELDRAARGTGHVPFLGPRGGPCERDHEPFSREWPMIGWRNPTGSRRFEGAHDTTRRPTTTMMLALALAIAAHADTDDLTPFSAVHAEHLWNRAGFGAGSARIERSVELGLEGTLALLFADPTVPAEPFFATTLVQPYSELRDSLRSEAMESDEELRDLVRDKRRDQRRADRRQMNDYTQDWLERMVDGESPVRDRMTLFWHGYFTSSNEDVKNSAEMIAQHRFLRENALGSFRTMLEGIARDPAMLEYLDNDANRKRQPNENFARELLELFTLGEGNYTERDVVEAARSFTGWTDQDGAFKFRKTRHDGGEKTFLGHTGKLDGDDVLAILLEQPQCAEHLAARLLAWFEGNSPAPSRVAEYATLMRDLDYEITPWLQALFRDPAFYGEEVVGQRIAGPVDLLVGHARRGGLEPPGRLLRLGTRILGQELFHPPSVKGWDGGRAWISTSTLMQRGNLAGILCGTVDAKVLLEDNVLDAVLAAAEEDGASESMEMMDTEGAFEPGELLGARRTELVRELDLLSEFGWSPRWNLTARLDRSNARTPAEQAAWLADSLLAIPVPAATASELAGWLEAELATASSPLEREQAFRRFAHLVLSLPEAQVH